MNDDLLATKRYVNRVEKENRQLRKKIKKGIKYIEERFTLDEETGGYHLTHTFDCDNICELYLILKGSDSNEYRKDN